MPNDALPKQAVLVVNAMSRNGADAFEQACTMLAEHGVDLIEAHPIKDPDGLQKAVRKALAQRPPMIIVGGGDGSLSSTIDDFLGTDTVFAILPLGTANSFSRSLGMGPDLEAAVDTIANGRKLRIDLGAIDGDYFVNAAAMGLSPLIAETIPHKLKKYLGIVGYLLWAVRLAFKFQPFRLTVDDGEKQHRTWATEARIFNGRYHGGVELVDDVDLQSGDIVVQAVTGRSLFGLAWSWFATLFKLRSRKQTTTEYRGTRLRISAKPTQRISIDGELSGSTPVTAEVARAAVWVAAPRTAET
ncbi:diacylglycerol kinase family protein [Sphingomonas sp. BN140010]|uniref:Diacylglycerol kinase family protein n=1 Tax=Sphingomonas arvum TaxID=2992113 RepID=A0ABT3JCH2_9SPHN|nr:diacylglycerol kinase family protein [Sphingomonas sp. BN140010]MCW3796776.1 diacylglycerol kinase family protein [Sphingomonas sp. BN140010]